jgi:GTP pyrophosphokinase
MSDLQTEWLSQHADNPIVQTALVSKAIQFVEGDEKLLRHGLSIADVLLPLHCDSYTIAASILLPSLIEKPTRTKSLIDTFDKPLYRLIAGAIQMNSLQLLKHSANNTTAAQNQIDNLRKMLLAMVDDVRVVLLKLADCLVMLNNLTQATAEKQQQAAQVVMDYFVPLANRLGLGQLKWQLEDRAFYYLNNKAYEDIAKALNKRAKARETSIQELNNVFENKLKAAGITQFSISGRAKHIYSIYSKMQRKKVPFEQLYDTQALRILVNDVDACYAVLSIVNDEWQSIAHEFDDYIAHPKSNGYQSIHTAIVFHDIPIEIQIRTFDMHAIAELGYAAHWKYKEKSSVESSYEEKIKWLRELLDWQQTFNEIQEEDNVYQQAFADRVYVFSPAGDVYDLPAGATPLDFAYLIHTNVGHRCKGAKINGKLMALTVELKTGDRVEIMTRSEIQPSRDWLRAELHYITTTNAARKIRHWFLQQEQQQHVQSGMALWDKAMKQKSAKKYVVGEIAKALRYKHVDLFFAALGTGELHLQQALNQLDETDSKPLPVKEQVVEVKPVDYALAGSLLSQVAKCCNPIPGDDILGYITQGKGISIHRTTCFNIRRALEERPEKVMEMHWKADVARIFRVTLKIVCDENVSSNIAQLMMQLKTQIVAINCVMNEDDRDVVIELVLALSETAMVKKIMQRILQIEHVVSVERV